MMRRQINPSCFACKWTIWLSTDKTYIYDKGQMQFLYLCLVICFYVAHQYTNTLCFLFREELLYCPKWPQKEKTFSGFIIFVVLVEVVQNWPKISVMLFHLKTQIFT